MRSATSTLQCLTATVVSSSRAPSRGWIQWRRGFSDGPSSGRDAFVSGDSHFRSVSESNSAFRRGEGRDFRNPGGFQRPPFRSPPPFHQPRPFRQPQTKPPDFRNWEYALEQPPSHCERFIVLSYNILADYLAVKHRCELYYHIPRHILDWEWRKRKIVFELGLWSADIMCFQEVDRFQDLEDELKHHGYSGIWKMRTGIPIDGCATFWRAARFKLLHEEFIEFNKLGLRDNIAQICVLESRAQNHAVNGSETFPTSSNGGNQVVVCNIHVLYNPKRGEIKLGQVRVLLDRAYAVSRLWNDAPVIICGDFNCTPKSPMYNFISEQKLNLTGLARDQISGQSSGQLYTPERYDRSPGRHMPRNQSPDNPNGASIQDDEKDFGMKHHNPDNIGNIALTNNFPQLQSDSCLQDMPSESCSDVHFKNENKNSGAGTEEEVVNKSPSSCQNKGVIPVDPGSEVSNGFTASSVHRISTEHSSSNTDQSSPVVVTVPEESSHFALGNESRFNMEIISSSENVAKFDEAAKASVSDTSSALVPQSFHHDQIDPSLIDLDDVDFKSRPESIEGNKDLDKCDTVSPDLQSASPSAEVQCDPSASVDLEIADVEKNSYDPYLWTPMEIETASGNSESTIMEHPLRLRSTYAEVEDYSGTRDSSREPQMTSYNRRFMGTVDYIWCSEGLQTVKVLDVIPKHALQWTPGLPTPKWGSDHLALASQLAFTKNMNRS